MFNIEQLGTLTGVAFGTIFTGIVIHYRGQSIVLNGH